MRDVLTEASDAVYAAALKRIEDARALVAEDAQKVSVATVQAIIDKFIEANGTVFPSEDEIQKMFSGHGIEDLSDDEKHNVFQMIAVLFSDAIMAKDNVHPVGGF